MCELSFDISYFSNSDFFNEISDTFINLFLEELLKSVWTEIVEKPFEILLLFFFLLIFERVLLFISLRNSTNVEIDSNIDCNSNIIFRWNIDDWTLISNRVFRYHDHNLIIAAACGVAAIPSWTHDTVIYSKSLFHGVDTIWNI